MLGRVAGLEGDTVHEGRGQEDKRRRRGDGEEMRTWRAQTVWPQKRVTGATRGDGVGQTGQWKRGTS
jgi:hypothetical protein